MGWLCLCVRLSGGPDSSSSGSTDGPGEEATMKWFAEEVAKSEPIITDPHQAKGEESPTVQVGSAILEGLFGAAVVLFWPMQCPAKHRRSFVVGDDGKPQLEILSAGNQRRKLPAFFVETGWPLLLWRYVHMTDIVSHDADDFCAPAPSPPVSCLFRVESDSVSATFGRSWRRLGGIVSRA